MTEYAIEFRDVVKRLGGTAVLDGLSFSVKKGELFAILFGNVVDFNGHYHRDLRLQR